MTNIIHFNLMLINIIKRVVRFKFSFHFLYTTDYQVQTFVTFFLSQKK